MFQGRKASRKHTASTPTKTNRTKSHNKTSRRNISLVSKNQSNDESPSNTLHNVVKPQINLISAPITRHFSLLTTSKRYFRRNGTLGIGSAGPKPPLPKRSKSKQGENESDTDSEPQHLVIPLDSHAMSPEEALRGLTPQSIASSIQDALQKTTGNKGLSIDPSQIQVMSIQEAKRLFHNPDDSDFEGINLNDLSDDGEDRREQGPVGFSFKRVPRRNESSADDQNSSDKNTHQVVDAEIVTDSSNTRPNAPCTPRTCEIMSLLDQSRERLANLSAPEIVAYLDAHVISQHEAKKALAIAVRNRERRFRLGNIVKPSPIMNIEEIGIRLSQKHGYSLRQELFSQIGRPTVYEEQYDPDIHPLGELESSVEQKSPGISNTTPETPSTTPTPGTSNPKNKKKKDVTTLSVTQQSNVTEGVGAAATTGGSRTAVPPLISDVSVKDYMIDRPSYLNREQTANQNSALLRNNLDYGRSLSREVNPFNILMSGPTGSGKSELVKRLADLLQAPYAHADATRYTETGVVGADIDQVLVDLYRDAIEREKKMEKIKVLPQARNRAIAAIVNAIRGSNELHQFLIAKGLNLFDNETNTDSQNGQKDQPKPTSTPSTTTTTTTPSEPTPSTSTKTKSSAQPAPTPATKSKTKTTKSELPKAAETTTTKKETKSSTKTKATQTTKTMLDTEVSKSIAAAKTKVGKTETMQTLTKKLGKTKTESKTADSPIKTPKKTGPKSTGSNTTNVTITSHTVDENGPKSTKKAQSGAKKSKKDLTQSDIEADLLVSETPSSQTTRQDGHTIPKIRHKVQKKGRGEEVYPIPPSMDSPQIQTTPFDADASNLFNTDVEDESTHYTKRIKPIARSKLMLEAEEKTRIENDKKAAEREEVKKAALSDSSQKKAFLPTFDDIKQWIKSGHLDDFVADIPLPVPTPPKGINQEQNQSFTIEELVGGQKGKEKAKFKNHRVSVKYALEQLIDFHCNDLVKEDELHERALKNCEQNGVVFIDEIDKLVASDRTHTTTSASKGEAVQRELLSLLQGKAVKRNGMTIQTENILFICAGAFHHASPAQLLPELQGRLPVVTKLNPLNQVELALVLTLPVYSILKQYMSLMKTDGIQIKMDDEAVWEMAKAAAELNERTMNLGARRLHNIVNSVFGYISYNYANGMRLEVDPLGRLNRITSNEAEKASADRRLGAQTQTTGQAPSRLQNSKHTSNTLSVTVPLDPVNVNVLDNGETEIVITKEYIQRTLKHMMDKVDVSRFLL